MSPQPTANEQIELLRQRLAALPPLVFYRRVQKGSLPGASQPIYGSVSLSDVTKHVQDEHGLTLVPPDAIVTFKGTVIRHASKLKNIGTWAAEVKLKTGEMVPLMVQIEKQREL